MSAEDVATGVCLHPAHIYDRALPPCEAIGVRRIAQLQDALHGVTVVVPTDVSTECSVCGYDPQAAADECAKHITEDRGRIAELETLLRQAVADDGGLYDLGLRAGRAAAKCVQADSAGDLSGAWTACQEIDECIAAADALEARIAAGPLNQTGTTVTE